MPATEGGLTSRTLCAAAATRAGPGGGTGRRNGLKIRRPHGHTGSIPVRGTSARSLLLDVDACSLHGGLHEFHLEVRALALLDQHVLAVVLFDLIDLGVERLLERIPD